MSSNTTVKKPYIKTKLESAVILKHRDGGYSATLRFNKGRLDVMLSADDHDSIYTKVEAYVSRIFRRSWKTQ